MLQAPALILSAIVASAYALAFFLWRGHGVRDLIFFWLASAVGFAAGQIAGELLGVIPWMVGQVHVVEASVLAAMFLLITAWLKQEERKR